MAKRLNLVGLRFDRLTVLSLYDVKYGHSRWLCKCDCGNEVIAIGSRLIRQEIKSCGCLKIDCAIELSKLNKKYNTYDLTGEYGIGYTFKGEEFYFDLEDYDKIKDYCWRVAKDGYIITTGGKCLHSLIMNTNEMQKIDHIKHIKKDNRKSQLRICTTQENNMNKKISKNNTSGCTGVYWSQKYQKWWASIKYNNKSIYLGSFNKFEDAVKTRKEAENKYFGEFSYDNSIGEECDLF